MGLIERLVFAWVLFFRVLFDGRLASRVRALPAAGAAPEPARDEPTTPPAPASEPKLVSPPKKVERDLSPALDLLGLLQEHGRLIDFLREDIEAASDADIGVAARVVHAGCRKLLAERVDITPLREEEEGARVTVAAGFSPAEIKLTGNLRGEPPFSGTLRHRGWRAGALRLPEPTEGHRAEILTPAEVEL